MNKTIKNRLQDLESKVTDPSDNHTWRVDIAWDDDPNGTHYYKDGIEISRSQYFREAPKNEPLNIAFRELIAAWQDPNDLDLWHLVRDMTDEPITWDEIERRYPENKKLRITPDGIEQIGGRYEQ